MNAGYFPTDSQRTINGIIAILLGPKALRNGTTLAKVCPRLHFIPSPP
jgi:hypothetical protein